MAANIKSAGFSLNNCITSDDNDEIIIKSAGFSLNNCIISDDNYTNEIIVKSAGFSLNNCIISDDDDDEIIMLLSATGASGNAQSAPTNWNIVHWQSGIEVVA